MKLWLAIGFFFLGLSVPSEGVALRIKSNYSVLAWNSTGTAVLLSESRRGPEGGGSSSFVLISADPLEWVKVKSSSDFSMGAGGSGPQRVSVAECTRQIKSLAKKMDELGFEGVSFKPAACRKEHRGVLPISSKMSQSILNARFKPKEGVGENHGFQLKTGENSFELSRNAESLVTVQLLANQFFEKGEVYIGVSGKLFIYLVSGEYGDTVLGGVFRQTSQAPLRYERIPEPKP